MIPGGPTFVALTSDGEMIDGDDNLDALLFELLSAMVTKHGREELVVWQNGSSCDTVAAVLKADGRTIRLDGAHPRVQLPPHRNGRHNGRHNAQDRSGGARKT
jgi:hypothetical protein